MAGVSLELKNILKKRSYFDILKAFSYAMALSGGPWLATVITVALISLLGLRFSSVDDMMVLTSTIMYVFAGSLIVMGPVFMVFSRYLADQSFLGFSDQRGALLLMELIILPLGWFAARIFVPYFIPLSVPAPELYHFMAKLLLTMLCGIWALMTYMDFQKRYAAPFHLFVIGSLISLAAAYVLRIRYSVAGLLTGFTIGIAVTFLGLMLGAFFSHRTAFEVQNFKPKTVLLSFLNFLTLAWIGLFYNIGIWIDKFVMWNRVGVQVGDAAMRIYTPYDISTFVAYPVMLPAMAYFLVLVETTFYDDYRRYLDSLESEPLAMMEERRQNMLSTLKRRMVHLLEFEGVLALAAFLLVPYGLKALGVEQETISIFRILIWAAALQVLFWVHLILLLYFEFRQEALAMALLFCASNAFFTYANVEWTGLRYGWGYVLSTALCLIVSWRLFHFKLKTLHKHLFVIHSQNPPYQKTSRAIGAA